MELSKQDILSLIATRLPDNTSNEITAEDLRIALEAILNASFNEGGSGLLRVGQGAPNDQDATDSFLYVDTATGRVFTSNSSNWVSFEGFNTEIDLGETDGTDESYEIDLSVGSIFLLTLTKDIELSVINAVKGKEYIVVFTQDEAGGYQVTIPEKFLFEGGNTPNTRYESNTIMELRFQQIRDNFHARFIADYGHASRNSTSVLQQVAQALAQ